MISMAMRSCTHSTYGTTGAIGSGTASRSSTTAGSIASGTSRRAHSARAAVLATQNADLIKDWLGLTEPPYPLPVFVALRDFEHACQADPATYGRDPEGLLRFLAAREHTICEQMLYVELLTREGELRIARRIEDGLNQVSAALAALTAAVTAARFVRPGSKPTRTDTSDDAISVTPCKPNPAT